MLGEQCNGHSLSVAYALGDKDAAELVHAHTEYWVRQISKKENAGLFGGM